MSDPRTVFPDNIYHTLSCTNNVDRAASLQFVNNGGSDICPNPTMYYLLVQKFVLSNRAFPIMQFDNRDSKYNIAFAVGAAPVKILAQQRDLRGDLLDGTPTLDNLPIYFIAQFVDVINRQLGNYTLSFTNGKFTITSAVAAPYLSLSHDLMMLFPTLEATFVNGRYDVVFRGLAAVQETQSLYALFDIKSILLVSNTLPILSQGYATNLDSRQKFRILNEFLPIYSQTSEIDKSDWIFESQEYRPIDMTSQESFSNFDYDIRIIRKSNETIQYKLLSGETASITFRMVKKALFNNEYNLANESARIKQNPSYNFHKKY